MAAWTFAGPVLFAYRSDNQGRLGRRMFERMTAEG